MPPLDQQVQILQAQVNELQTMLATLIGSDRYTIQKDLEMFDGRNIQLATGTGTKIGTGTNQKLGLYGVTPVVQGSAINAPSIGTVSGTGDDSTINSNFTANKNAINSLRTAISNIGITA